MWSPVNNMGGNFSPMIQANSNTKRDHAKYGSLERNPSIEASPHTNLMNLPPLLNRDEINIAYPGSKISRGFS